MEHFVGVDLHKRVSQLAALREPKPASQLRFLNDAVTVEKVLKKLPRRYRDTHRPGQVRYLQNNGPLPTTRRSSHT